MLEPKNLLMAVIAIAVLVIFGYMLSLMITPNPYAETIVSHAKSDNHKAASQILATIKGSPGCDKLDISQGPLLKYFKSQECFMLKTEMQTRLAPTNAELLNHGNTFITGLSSKLKTCISPDKQSKLVAQLESGKHLKAFSKEIDRSKDVAGKLELINQEMNCGT